MGGMVRDIHIGRNVKSLLVQDPRLTGRKNDRHEILMRVLARRHGLFDGSKRLGELVEHEVRRQLGPSATDGDYATPVSGWHEETLEMQLEQSRRPNEIYLGRQFVWLLYADPRLKDAKEDGFELSHLINARLDEVASGKMTLFELAEDEIQKKTGARLPAETLEQRRLQFDVHEEWLRPQFLVNEGKGREAHMRSQILYPIIRTDGRVEDDATFLKVYRAVLAREEEILSGGLRFFDAVDGEIRRQTGKALAESEAQSLREKCAEFDSRINRMDQFGALERQGQ